MLPSCCRAHDSNAENSDYTVPMYMIRATGVAAHFNSSIPPNDNGSYVAGACHRLSSAPLTCAPAHVAVQQVSCMCDVSVHGLHSAPFKGADAACAAACATPTRAVAACTVLSE